MATNREILLALEADRADRWPEDDDRMSSDFCRGELDRIIGDDVQFSYEYCSWEYSAVNSRDGWVLERR